jgi:hypothetical protein
MKILAIALMLAVQSGTLSGEWAVDAPQTEGLAASGENWVLVAQSGGLTLDQKGDAVTGSFKGRAPEPWPLTGRVDGDTFELQTVFRDLPVCRDGVKGTIRRRGGHRCSPVAY